MSASLPLSHLSFSLRQCHRQSFQLQQPLNVGSHNNLNYSRSQKCKLCLFAGFTAFDGQSTKSTSSWAVDLVGKTGILLQKQESCFGEEIGRLPTNREEVNQNLVEEREGSSTSHEAVNIELIEENGIRPTKEGAEIVENYVVQGDDGVHIKEEAGVWGSLERNNGKLLSFQVSDFIEKIINSPANKRAEVLDLFEKDVRFLMTADLNNLLMELVKADELEFAVQLFDKLPSYGLVPDSRTFSVMVRCYCKKNDLDKARQVLDDMVRSGLRPNVVTFTILINGNCRRGRLQKAFEIFEVMGRIGCLPTVQTYNCLLNGLCYVGRVEEACELLMKIKNSSKKPDIYTYTVVMDGFCKVGRSDEAMELLKEALEMGLNPTVVTFNTLFNGYCKEGRPSEGITLLKQMKERDCHPDYITYSTLLHGLLKWSEIPAALQIYKEMLEIRFEIDERMMNILLRAICRRSWADGELLKDAEELFERIKNVGLGPHPSTYCLMIQSLSIRGQIDRALANLHEMMRLGYPPRMITFNTVVRALCVEGRVDDALLVLLVMVTSSTSPGRISYNLIIDELNQQGRLLGASVVYGAALKRGVIPHCKPRVNG
ncbi:pentatricopeptide repeat-containing protein At1g09900-like [Telopea speciosissima]|uniref:pentatricopeptide repeat-containing protein At1g09900-like n=1 Tax=Telopea speciosissima TaxID=54955 RepID=UPI001CC4761D|nr:pentatricopeptide repeat-containing protein At1g09900-like [Telopea speciosissima]